MDVEESVNSFVQIYQFMATDDTPIDEPISESFPAANFEKDWTVVVNADPMGENDVVVFPSDSSKTTVRPMQALIFLGEDHRVSLARYQAISTMTDLKPVVCH